MGATPVRALNSIKRDEIGGVANNSIEWRCIDTETILGNREIVGKDGSKLGDEVEDATG